jgi:hypothetical protein
MERKWVVVERGHTSIVSEHASREVAARAARALTEVSGLDYHFIEKRPREVAPWPFQVHDDDF